MSLDFQTIRDVVSARRRSFGLLAFFAVLAFACQIYLSFWQAPALAKAQKEWFAKRDALAKGETLADSAKYQNGMRDLEELGKRLIPKQGFPAFLSRLYDTGKRNSLALSGIGYKPTKVKGEPILAYGVSFTVTGKYGSVKSFLADLTRYREMVTIDSVSLSNVSSTEEKVSLRIQTTVYLTTEGA